jgi:hypothetical protein
MEWKYGDRSDHGVDSTPAPAGDDRGGPKALRASVIYRNPSEVAAQPHWAMQPRTRLRCRPLYYPGMIAMMRR